MRTITLSIILFLITPCVVYGQSQSVFDFEHDLESWKTSKGKIYLTTEYYKEGKQSLAWEAPDKAELTIEIAPVVLSPTKAAAFYIHSTRISEGSVTVRFYNGKELLREGHILLNFSGWRAFHRGYADYGSDKSGKADRVTFVCSSGQKEPVVLHFDDMRFDAEADKNFLIGPHMSPDRKEIQHGTALLDLYNNPTDIAPTAPTATERKGIALIAAQTILTFEKASEKQLAQARDFIRTLSLTRNKERRMTGKPVNLMNRMSNDEMLGYLSPLAALASSEVDKDLCRDYIDYLLEQGIAEGINFQMRYSDYAMVRKAPLALFAALQVATDMQRPELLKFISWITEYGKLYYPETEYQHTMNADILTNYLHYYMAYALAAPDDTRKVAGMKAFSRFLCRQTEYTPGDRGILKADGTGFHHKSHYNNYMYAFRYWIHSAYLLKGTVFRIDEAAFNRMSKAVTSMYIMMGRDKNDNRFSANSLSGRNAYYKAGSKAQVYKKEFKQLIEIGRDIQEKPFDDNLASAYNYFFMTDEYDVPATAYTGFFQFNYSPIGVYRTDNWVATMRSPTTRYWGSELYNNTNRLGRYQSHGTVEVIYNGGLTASGLPANEDCGGWDWNVVPGTTTVHYTDWTEMMPSANTSHRFDQYTLTKDFAGALAWGEMGVFAADFDQIDRWGGKQNYEPTHLVYKKSVFACNGMMICLGSGIGAQGKYADDMITATNLFQEIKSKKSGWLTVNGKTIEAEGFEETLSPEKVHYMLTPMSTGYIIPAGNDPIAVRYGVQTTPKQTGEDASHPKVTQVAAKAYVNHGVKTTGKQYAFIVVPQTTSENLEAMAGRLEEIYRVERLDEHVHALSFLAKGVDAYTFFAPANDLQGIVKGATTSLLLLTKAENNTRSFAICNPNHNPKADTRFGWISQPTEGYFILKGKWINNEDRRMDIEHKEGETWVHYRLSDGMPEYFTLTCE